MPTYEYECLKCKTKFEVFQSMMETPLDTCRSCGGKLRRLFGSGAGIIFKGSGFYATDYRSKSYKESEKKEKASEDPPCKSRCPNKDICDNKK